jgi:hypothetical protein
MKDEMIDVLREAGCWLDKTDEQTYSRRVTGTWSGRHGVVLTEICDWQT